MNLYLNKARLICVICFFFAHRFCADVFSFAVSPTRTHSIIAVIAITLIATWLCVHCAQWIVDRNKYTGIRVRVRIRRNRKHSDNMCNRKLTLIAFWLFPSRRFATARWSIVDIKVTCSLFNSNRCPCVSVEIVQLFHTLITRKGERKVLRFSNTNWCIRIIIHKALSPLQLLRVIWCLQ